MTKTKARRALISLSDKTGAADFALRLQKAGVEILSTGGTAKALREAGVDVVEVADVTGFPEILGGRVKTLHPSVHGGLLADRKDPDHIEALRELDIAPIDVLAVNLYPFAQTLARGGSFAECLENIDIGGPAMIRAAAKNHQSVLVLTDWNDYERAAAMLEGDGVSENFAAAMAAKAFSMTAAYDAAVSEWMRRESAEPGFPQHLAIGGAQRLSLRYGENPHQQAALYETAQAGPCVARARLLQGKPLSYNNLADVDAAFGLVSEFAADHPAVVIVKHANPCGAALGDSDEEAYAAALRCDPVSAFGGVVAVNQPLTGPMAARITSIFTEVVIAPEADDEACAIFARKKNLRLLVTGGLLDPTRAGLDIKVISGGFLAQERDARAIRRDEARVVTKKEPTSAQWRDLLFAFGVAKHVKSNAIVFARDGATVGIGAGQMSRLDSTRIAARKAQDAAEAAGATGSLADGAVAASDAFFPFPDGMLAAVEAGARAIIQPGGSIKDEEVIAAADDAGVAMVFTGQRHFRH